jgi:hypothetical protein
MVGNGDTARGARLTIVSERATEPTKPGADTTTRSSGERKLRLVSSSDSTESTSATGEGTPGQPRDRQQRIILDRSLHARIGGILRDSFADIEREPLPKRLQDLIEELQAKEEGPR